MVTIKAIYDSRFGNPYFQAYVPHGNGIQKEVPNAIPELDSSLESARDRPAYMRKHSRKFDDFLGDVCDEVYSRIYKNGQERYYD
jgi:hypothetical protein